MKFLGRITDMSEHHNVVCMEHKLKDIAFYVQKPVTPRTVCSNFPLVRNKPPDTRFCEALLLLVIWVLKLLASCTSWQVWSLKFMLGHEQCLKIIALSNCLKFKAKHINNFQYFNESRYSDALYKYIP